MMKAMSVSLPYIMTESTIDKYYIIIQVNMNHYMRKS